MRQIMEKIPDILLAQLAAFSLVYGLTSSLLLTYPPLSILLLVMLFVVLLFIFFYNRITTIVTSVLIGVTFLTTLIYIAFGVGMAKVAAFLDGYFYWLGDFIQYPETPDPTYQTITVIFLAVVLSVFSYIFIVRKFLFLVIALSGIGMFGVQWSYEIVSILFPFYLYLGVTLISYIKHIYTQKLNAAAEDFAKPGIITVWSLPVSIIIIALALSFHASSKPIEWKWLDKKIVSVYNYFSRNLDYEAFDYFSLSASSGFGDRNNILGGRVRLDRTNVLRVAASRNVYLKGVVQDVFTGTVWTNTTQKKTPLGSNYKSIYGDTTEMLDGMRILTGKDDFLKEYFTENRVKVTFLNLKTKSIFLPEKSFAFSPVKVMNVFTDKTGSISAGQRLSKGFTYNVDLYTPAIGTDEFAEVMKKSKRGLYGEYLLKADFPTYYQSVKEFNYPGRTTSSAIEDGINIIYDTGATSKSAVTTLSGVTTGSAVSTASSVRINGTDASGSAVIGTSAGIQTTLADISKQRIQEIEFYQKIKALKEKSDSIYKTDLQLPLNLPQRVKDLAASLVANSKTDYEKAKAIEQYLSKNFPYNLDVRSTPRNRDFVDYFLFDLKQGYCSYYASAMAVLARCAGLPARYVEGYMLPPEPTKDSSTTFIVTNMQAHAWVEIYFEGYGWLPFEPTSPFSANFYATKNTDAVISTSYNSSYEDYMVMMRKYMGDRDPGDLSGLDTVQERKPAYIFVLVAVGVLVLLFVILLLFNITRSRLKLYRISNMPAKDCILKYYDYYVNVLTLLGLGLVPAETPIQYSARIDTTMFFSPVRFKVITEIFMKARYSLQETNEKEKLLFCDFHQGFLDEVKINMGKSKFFLYKFILGRF